MRVDHVLHVFRKDGIELLRDRRTLFVNVLLPLLLYPLIMLFLVQVTQLTRDSHAPPPRVALLGLPDRLDDLVLDPPRV
ncbi:MAG: hypothetical protein H0W72_07015, partial [Planctomycetes bacterium]|nr:hypothetical protein [Planctomycetota bacterium]